MTIVTKRQFRASPNMDSPPRVKTFDDRDRARTAAIPPGTLSVRMSIVNDRYEQDRQQSTDGPEICQRTRPLHSSERSKSFPKPARQRFGDALRGNCPA